MSEGGIYLFAAADLPTGAEVKVEVATDASEKMISRSGIVRNRAIYLYGVEFIAGDRHKPGLASTVPEIPTGTRFGSA
jgi:hypothetical protein